MAKKKSAYVCENCGYESAGWYGKCPSCGAWNTLVEAPSPEPAKPAASFARTGAPRAAVPIRDIEGVDEARDTSGVRELDRVLGGGIVRGSVTLLCGDPGIGKSTLLLQMSANLARAGRRTLYISGEESLRQIALRARRTGDGASGVLLLAETNVDEAVSQIEALGPAVAVVDSIQTMACPGVAGFPGSVSQIRESASRLLRCAKENGVGVFLVGHVTKEGTIAGPRVLEHMVDTVLYFEGDARRDHRILRAVKNRFGSTNEIGIFHMTDGGMEPVEDPTGILISHRDAPVAGCAVVCVLEGTRPVNVEVQALVSQSAYGSARRTANGFDYNRMAMLLAVLEKRANLPLAGQDAYVNVAGGLKLDDPAADLGVAAALVSAFCGKPAGDDVAFIGEIALTGEVRSVQQMDRRLSECAALGFRRVVTAPGRPALKIPDGLEVVPVPDVRRLVRAVFGRAGGET